MPPVAYSGALQPKRKNELQELALALGVSDQGTKDELQARIKKHLDDNQDTLEDQPAFTGLYGRRKRSVQPTSRTEEKPRSFVGRRVAAMEPLIETPPKELRDVSMFLKRPPSPAESTPERPTHPDLGTPSSLPPLPPSPGPSPIKSLIERLPKKADVTAAVEQFKQQEILQNGSELFIALRAFLSNSRNIWSLTALFELFYILYAIIPWQSYAIKDTSLAVVYPPLTVFQTAAFWKVLLHWATPTLFVPAVVGSLISFTPTQGAAVDPLTASIIRLAAQIGYPYASFTVVGLDVLGPNWRIWSASVGAAFAFAEAISSAPQTFAKTLVRQQRQLIASPSVGRAGTPSRLQLVSHQGQDADEF